MKQRKFWVFQINEAAKLLDVSINTLRRWDKSGKITIQRDQSGNRVFTQEVINYLKNYEKPHVYISENKEPLKKGVNNSSLGFVVAGLMVVSIALIYSGVLLSFLDPTFLKQRLSLTILSIIGDDLKKNYQEITQNINPTGKEVLGQNDTISGAGFSGSPLFLPTNQIVNSSFEGGNLNADPKGYSLIGQSTSGNTKVTNQSIHSGTLALKLNDDNCTRISSGCQLGISQPSIQTINGRDYQLSVWVRIKNSELGIKNAKLRVGLFGEVSKADPVYLDSFSHGTLNSSFYIQYSQDRYEDFDLSDKKDNTWVRLVANFSNLPLGKYPIIEAINYKGGTIYVDDVDLNEGQAYSSTLGSSDSNSIFPSEQNNIRLADNSLAADSLGNIYPATTDFTGASLGITSKTFQTLYLRKLSVDKDGNLATSGNISGKDISASGNITATGTITSNSTSASSFSGNISSSGVFLAANGSAAAPSYSFTNSQTTGLFRAAADALGISTAGSERLRIDSSGNVGIGTTSPNDKLEVSGDVRLGSGTEKLHIGNTGTDLAFNRNTSSGTIFNSNAFAYQLHHAQSVTDASDNLAFQVYNTAGGNVTASALAITGQGNVGIGTTGPGAKFHVYGTSGATVARIESTDTTSASQILLGDGNSQGVVEFVNSAFATTARRNNLEVFNQNGSGGITFHTNNTTTPRVTIDSTGNVGIGATGPNYKLDVNGGSGASQVRFGTSTANDGGFLTAATSSDIVVSGGASYNGANWVARTSGAGLVEINGGAANPFNWFANSGLTIGNTFAPTIVMTLSSTGNLNLYGNATWNADNTYDIGAAAATRPRTGYFGTGVYIGGNLPTTGTIRLPWQSTVYARNSANNLNVNLIRSAVLGGTVDGVEVGDASYRTDVVGGEVHFNSIGTTASAANAFVDSTNTNILLRSTSSLRYKNLIANLSLPDAQNIILNAQPIVYTSKSKADNPNTIYVGFAAEQIATVDARFVTFDGQGLPNWVQYPVLTAPLTLVAQNHEKRISDLEKLVLSSSNSATLTASSSASFDNLTVQKKLLTNDLGITGNISAGLLSIKGLDSTVASGSATINTISDLYLQNLGAGGINFLNGKVLIDKAGNLTAKKYNIDTADSASSSAGRGVIKAGTTSIAISTTSVSDKSEIFVTLRNKTNKQPLVITNQTPGTGFTVEIEEPLTSDVSFSWFLVN